ncbi:uncharacterized protein LOC110445840 [Mizuhopecten yessoensis]|uniref:uncharacterized protein LOC110445840 n=1 Tax=Mizuhopecten yessoensis TaxID=6573 RepID=UPI000B4572DE|nr:uncharacterized protein LOC110445840 [Mizuhopecten yessoensis]XP_021346327.1 uncharacterized protein LOC110445840 [Mizuhopecten yessoensis]
MASSITGSKDSELGQDAASETEIDDEHDLPLDYELNVTLDKIAQQLTDKDLDRMKFLYSGECGLGRRVQKEITTPLQFFDHMKRSRRLDRNNLLHVQALLWNLGKKDLYKIFVEFARQCNRAPLHFYSNDIDEGDTERSPVRFHISGVTTDRRQIQKLQGLLAKLLVTPEATIALNGVKPFHSIVVTFLIPNSAVAILKDLTSEEKGLLQQCDVDCVFIGEFKISIKDEKFETPEKLNERDEVNKLLNRNKQLQKDLEDTETRLIRREKELVSLQPAVSGSDTPDKSRCIYRRSTSGSKMKIRRASSHYDVLNEISLRLSDEHRTKLSVGYTFTTEEEDQLQQNKHHVLRVLIDKDIKVDIRNRVLKLLRKLDDDSILEEAELYLSKLPEIDIDLVEEPTFDEEPEPDAPRIISN